MPSISSPARAPVSRSARPIFALLIGVNEYQQNAKGLPKRLQGCVEDANSINNFLMGSLNVPPEHIRILQNKHATRAAIISAFREHLIDNSAIKQNDTLIFYFAGHGSRKTAPRHWPSEDGKVETICPYDTVHANGIPDYTLGHLIRKLAQARGNNIIAIFDSCHSGGMGREGEEESKGTFNSRCFSPHDDATPLPDDLDSEILSSPTEDGGSRAINSTVSPGSMYKAMSSHVLLAACQPGETAWESRSDEKCSGLFTKALISALGRWRADSVPMTYSGLIESLPVLQNQHPHCEGDNRVRYLFDPSSDGEDSTAFVVTSGDETNSFYIAAGKIHGVQIDTEFRTQPRSRQNDIHLKAIEVEEFRCKVTVIPPKQGTPSISLTLPEHSRAAVSSWMAKWLKVELRIPPGALPLVCEDDSQFSFVSSDADLTISWLDASRNHVVLTRNDPLMKEFTHCRSIQVKPNTITTDYLNDVSLFHFLLHQRNESKPQTFTPSSGPKLSASLQKLKYEGEDEDEEAIYAPTGDNLFSVPKSEGNWTAEAVISDVEFYLLTLENGTKRDLFVNVFYLDPSTYGRALLYKPYSSRKPSLVRHGGGDIESSRLAIGYGAHANDRLRFKLPKDKDCDTGFIKVFVSTEYINMEVFSKPTAGSRLELDRTPLPAAHLWNSWTYAITAKRPTKGAGKAH